MYTRPNLIIRQARGQRCQQLICVVPASLGGIASSTTKSTAPGHQRLPTEAAR